MDNRKVDQIIDKYDGKPSTLIQILLDIQRENHWLPQEILEKVSLRLDVPMNQVLRTASFHKAFSLVPEGNHKIHVCNGTSCHVRGSQRLIDSVQNTLGIKSGETSPDYKFSLETFTCLGNCSSGPNMVIDGENHEQMTPTKAEEVLKKLD
jgi:NADH-quinone oxidoreductase subunit E